MITLTKFGHNTKTMSIVASLLMCSISIHANADVIDDNTQATSGITMHICGVGLMSGLHVGKNDFLCNIVARENPGIDDTRTQRSGMHACPTGLAMMGFHEGKNVLKCTIPTNGSLLTYTEYLDTGTQRNGMHACPDGWVMTGVHVKKNDFLCTRLD